MSEGLKIVELLESKPFLYFSSFLNISISILTSILLGFSIYYLIHIGNRNVENIKRISIGKKHIFYFIIVVIMGIGIAMLYQLRYFLWKLLNPLIWAFVFAYLLNPIVCKINRKGFSRLWSVILVYVSIIGFIIIFSIIITPKILREMRSLMEELPKYTEEISQFINQLYDKIEKMDNVSPLLRAIKEPIQENLFKLQNYILEVLNRATKMVFNIFSRIVSLALIPIYAFYFLNDAEYFKKKMTLLIPKTFRNELIQILKEIDLLINKFIRGQLIVAAFVGALSTIALWIIKVDFAFTIGMIAGIIDIIPYIGPIIGIIPAVIFALLDEPSKALWVIIAFTAIQQIESAILSPKIVGESVGLHPVMIILSLFIGNEVMGIPGMLFAVPIVASIKVIIKRIVDYIA